MMSTTAEVVTPEQARLWLASSNKENRALRHRWVETLAREIREGRWEKTGDSIKFDVRGILIDGQHRLAAIAAADRPVELIVARGLATAVRDVVDTGMRRTAGDVLGFAGMKSGGHVAAVVRLALAREDGLITTGQDTRRGTYTSSKVLSYIEFDPKIAEWAIRTRAQGRPLGYVPAAWSYATYVLHTVDETAAHFFISTVLNSQTDGIGDPRLTLIVHGRSNVTGANAATASAETIYRVFRCWNAWRSGERLTQAPAVSKTSGSAGIRIPTPL